MKGTIVTLHRMPYRSVVIHFADRRFPLHALTISCGHSKETQSTYDWDGLSRGKREFAVLQLTISGSGALTYEGNDYALKPSDLMIVHIPHNHRYRLPPASSHWEFVYAVVVGREILRVVKRVETAAGPIVKLAKDSSVIGVLSAILRHALAGDFREGTSKQFLLSDLTYSLGMAILKESLPLHGSIEPPSWLEEARKYCRDHLADEITVSRLAEIAGLSRSHFCRAFTSKTGLSPREYLTQERMRRAVQLLYERSSTVKEIGYLCGYRDENYFCRAFRKIMGISPGEYRKSGL